MHLFSPRPVVNFIATVDDPVGSASLDLPLLQKKPHIHCMCSCILMELLILPCNIVHKSSDNTFPSAVWFNNILGWNHDCESQKHHLKKCLLK
jgi:hypothetical protein